MKQISVAEYKIETIFHGFRFEKKKLYQCKTKANERRRKKNQQTSNNHILNDFIMISQSLMPD